jgi:hypothetical protein
MQLNFKFLFVIMHSIRFILLSLVLVFPCLLNAQNENQQSLSAVLPFVLNEKGVTLTIKLNDSTLPLTFLLDTGADGMAIRKTLADSLQLKTGYSQDAYIVGGKKKIDISTGNTVHLSDTLSLTGQNIAIFDDISGMDGIIGMNLLKKYITRFDFDKQELQLFQPGHFPLSPEILATIPVNMHRNLILIGGELDLTGKKSVKGNFLLDTGAHYHLIAFSRFVRKNRLLLSGFKPEGMASTVSMGHATPVYHGTANRFAIDDEIFLESMPVTLQASSGTAENEGEFVPDGSIGILFFKHYNFTIDLQAKVLHLEKRLTTDGEG